MDKMKCLWRDLSLRKSIVIYITAFVVIALILSMLTAALCNTAAENIKNSYPPTGEKYYLTNADGEQLGEGTYIGDISAPLSEKDQRLVSALETIPIVAAPIYSALCILAAAMLFYRNKLKKPLTLLTAASNKISHNDLDFSVDYQSTDELGRLCASFETMRQALAQNFSVMWRQMEERKQLNAAFAHDLRTPLTVLKGYNEMLQANDNQQARDTALTMGKHISRMERYVDSMSRLQRIEDAEPEYRVIQLPEFVTSLSTEAELICTQENKKLVFVNLISSPQVSADPEAISQVFNNLISNAVRYAVSCVQIIFEEKNGGLLLSVSDDGKGFSLKGLQSAATPYFTEETNHSEHFGLGLYICKTLCEHHGGYLKMNNSDTGGIVKAFFKTRAA